MTLKRQLACTSQSLGKKRRKKSGAENKNQRREREKEEKKSSLFLKRYMEENTAKENEKDIISEMSVVEGGVSINELDVGTTNNILSKEDGEMRDQAPNNLYFDVQASCS